MWRRITEATGVFYEGMAVVREIEILLLTAAGR
jgi:hypothetical protein